MQKNGLKVFFFYLKIPAGSHFNNDNVLRLSQMSTINIFCMEQWQQPKIVILLFERVARWKTICLLVNRYSYPVSQ